MIKITIEVLPHGIETERYEIASAEITKINPGNLTRGDYKYHLWLKRNKVWKTGIIKGFPRKSYSVWYLLKRILERL